MSGEPARCVLLGPTTRSHRVQRGALGVGVGGAARVRARRASSIPTQFLRSYLVAYLFWVGIALGCLAILMIQHVTGRRVGRRRSAACSSRATRTLPLMALLFLPLALGLGTALRVGAARGASRTTRSCSTRSST